MSKILRWKPACEHWGKQTGIPSAFLLAIIQQESGGNCDAVRYEPEYQKRYCGEGSKGAEIARIARIPIENVATSYGLMQLMLPLAWGYMSIEDKKAPTKALLDGDKNIRYGAAHLATLWKRYGGNMRKVAGAYNGAGSTSNYALCVERLYRRYNGDEF